jgi:hypothetical protein
VFTGLKSPYHKPGDKAELLDYAGMGEVTDFMVRLLDDIANQPTVAPNTTMLGIQKNPTLITRPVSVGLSGYLGMGRHLYKDEFYDAKNDVAFSIGLYLNYKITKSLALQLEGLYDQNASQSAAGRFVRHAVAVPLNIQFGRLAYIEGGAYFKHHFDGNDGGEPLDFMQTYRKQEWGYNVGAGLRYSHYRVGFVQRGSFQSIYQQGPKVVPTAWYLNLGYSF